MSTHNFQITTQNDVQSDANLPAGENPEFDAFEQLARKLVGVSKADLDAKRAEANG